MPGLPQKQMVLLRTFISQLPASALDALERALSASTDGPLMAVSELVTAESDNRQLRSLVFAPYINLFKERPDGIEGKRFPNWVLDRLWAYLCQAEAQWVSRARSDLMTCEEGTIPYAFKSLIQSAAAACRLKADQLLPTSVVAEEGEATLEEFAQYLDLHRFAHDMLPRLNEFTQRPNKESVASLKLFYRDASELNAEGGEQILEIVFADMKDAIQITRMISILSDRPNDRYMSQSELADFGQRFIDHFDEVAQSHLSKLRGDTKNIDFNAMAVAFNEVMRQIHVFQDAFELTKDGPWGGPIQMTHKKIIASIEDRIRQCEKLLDEVLPIQSGRGPRALPRLDRAPRPEQQKLFVQLVSFIKTVQPYASNNGYATLLNKTLASIEHELDDYFEGLLAIANGPENFDYSQLMLSFDRLEELMRLCCDANKGHTARRRVACLPIVAKYKDLAS